MESFVKYLIETTNLLSTDKRGVKTKGNPAGILHELLVGYYLNGGTGDARAQSNKKYHMKLHPGEGNISPFETFMIKLPIFSDEQYKIIADRAKRTAEAMLKKYEEEGVIISDVHWTSRPGQTEATTGIKATNKQDDSDLVVTLVKKGSKIPIFDGVSLKAYEKWKNTINASNNRIEKTENSDKIVTSYRKKLLALTKGKEGVNQKERKAFFKDSKNKKIQEQADALYLVMRKELRNDFIKHLKKMTPEQLSKYVRKALHAEETPSQQQGHWHHRWEVFGLSGKTKIFGSDPSADMNDILDAIIAHPELVTIEAAGEIGINISYNNHKIVQPTFKIGSKSDYFGSMLTIGMAYFQSVPKGQGWRTELNHSTVVNNSQKKAIEKMPVEKNNDAPGGGEWNSPDELPQSKTKPKKEVQMPAKKKPAIVDKKETKLAVKQAFKKQPTSVEKTGRVIDWKGIQSAFTTTTVSVDTIATTFKVDPSIIYKHARQKNWHNPRKHT